MANEKANIGGTKTSRRNWTYNITLRRIVIISIIVLLAFSLLSASFCRVISRQNWSIELALAREYSWDMQVYQNYGFPLLFENQSAWSADEVNSNSQELYAVTQYIHGAEVTVSQLSNVDTAHSSELGNITNFLFDMVVCKTYLLNSTSQTTVLRDLNGLVTTVPDAYIIQPQWWYSQPSFWYFGSSPPNGSLLQNATNLANQGDQLIHGLPNR